MRPEFELLVACARARLDTAQADRVRRLLSEGLDWDVLVPMAHKHGVMPLLHRGLQGSDAGAVPPSVLNQIRRCFYHHVACNLFLTDELLRILDLLEAHGIEAIPFKGPALAALLHGDLTLRPFADLDLLIRRQDVPRAKELLMGQGYRPSWHLTPLQERVYLRAWCEYVFRGEAGQVVELHWRLVPRYFVFPLDPEELWERLQTMPLQGRPVRTFSPEDWTLILCVHGTKHLWERLRWVVDIADLVSRYPGMDWEGVLRRARALGVERMVLLGLGLAQDWLAVPLPVEIASRIRSDPRVRALSAAVEARLSLTSAGSPHLLQRVFFHLRARERLSDKVRYCLRLAVTLSPRDWTFWPLPSGLFPLYYILRPLRLIRQHASAYRAASLGREGRPAADRKRSGRGGRPRGPGGPARSPDEAEIQAFRGPGIKGHGR